MEQNNLDPFKTFIKTSNYLARVYWVHLSVPDMTLIS